MPDLTNLLPSQRSSALRRLYFMRLAVVAALLLAAVAVAHAIFLLPSFLYLREEVSARSSEIARIDEALAGAGEQAISSRVDALTDDAAYLARLAETPKASNAVRMLLAVPRPGIRISGFSYAAGAEGTAAVNLSGVASSRESLRSYEQSLMDQPYIATAELPIGAYAQEQDIEFTILLTGPFMP